MNYEGELALSEVGGLIYRKLANKGELALFVLVSFIIHMGIFLFLKKGITNITQERIDEITLIDQTLPEGLVREPPKRGILDMIFQKEEVVSEPEPSTPPNPYMEEQPKGIDIQEKELDRSQAAIKIEESEDLQGATEVIRVAKPGEGKTTEEILAQAPISVNPGKGVDRGEFGGLFSSPGNPGGPALEIDTGKEIKKEGLETTIKKTPKETEAIQVPVAKSSFSITGPLRNRKILSKVIPQYPEWAQEKGASAVVSLHLSVDPDGTVQYSVFIEQTSGSADWDREVADALRRWRFAPLAEDVVQEVQEGVITFRFTL